MIINFCDFHTMFWHILSVSADLLIDDIDSFSDKGNVVADDTREIADIINVSANVFSVVANVSREIADTFNDSANIFSIVADALSVAIDINRQTV